MRWALIVVASITGLHQHDAGAHFPLRDAVPSAYAGRSGLAKEKLLKQYGGGKETEEAVALGLAWLARQQKSDGSWEFDGSHKANRIAATGLCLLPFLGAGETQLDSEKYKNELSKGIAYLAAQMKEDGQFGHGDMYEQGIATIALCEAYGMSGDEKLKQVAARAVKFIVEAQSPIGSWGYVPRIAGDTSIVGWQIEALHRAKLAGLDVPEKTLQLAEKFLISVSDDDESGYGYATKGTTHTMTACGLLSRILIRDNAKMPFVARGVKKLESQKPFEEIDMYFLYHATQVAYYHGGKEWADTWNPELRKSLLKKQITSKTQRAKQTDVGSFPKDSGFIGRCCGKVGTTAMILLTLEVYYRNPPLRPQGTDKR